MTLNLTSYDKVYPQVIKKYNDLFLDQNMSVLDKIDTIITYLNSVGKLTNDVVTRWNNVMQWAMNDGLMQYTNNKLTTMMSDGEFNSLLNTLLLADVGDITKLNKDIVSSIQDIQSKQTTDETNITNLQTQQTTNTNDIASIKTKQTTDETNISTNSTNISNNATTMNKHIGNTSNPHNVTASQVGALTQNQADARYPLINQPSWNNVSLPANVSNQSGSTTRWMKDTLGFVHIEIFVGGSGITPNMVLFTLPSGSIPNNLVSTAGITYGTNGIRVCRVSVNTSGQVYLNENADTGWLCVAFSFKADL